jgi:D-alanine-D-alanine ligase
MIRVGVVRGGVSDGYEASLASGAFVLQNLPKDRYTPVDIFIDRDGVWHLQGRPLSPDMLAHRVDVLWNLTNGFYGADGKMHQLFEQLGVPYVGATPFASAELAHHGLLRNRLTEKGHKTPRSIYVASWKEDIQAHVSTVVKAVFQLVSPPWIVRAISLGHMQGHIACATREELTAVLLHMADAQVPVVIEETITGTPVSVMMIPGLRNTAAYVTVPHAQNTARTALLREDATRLSEKVRAVCRDVELPTHVQIAAVLGKNGEVYITEIDAHPDFSPGSSALHSLEHLGISFAEFSDSVIKRIVK